MTLRIYYCEKCQKREPYYVRITDPAPPCKICGAAPENLKQIWDKPPIVSIDGLPRKRF